MADVRAYFERGFIACYAWMMVKRDGYVLSDAVLDHAWEHRDEGMTGSDRLEAGPQEVEHPMASASLVEVLDYAALRLSQERAEGREWQLATDRFDEAYMWAVAARASVSGDQ